MSELFTWSECFGRQASVSICFSETRISVDVQLLVKKTYGVKDTLKLSDAWLTVNLLVGLSNALYNPQS